VYLFFEGTVNRQSAQMMTRSFDGGISFEKPRPVAAVTDVGVFDPAQDDIAFDGFAGARTNSFPSVDIANGAPTGVGAPDTIALSWADASLGLNNERALVQLSSNGGTQWSGPFDATEAGDRPDFPAVALSPNGQTLYVVYDAFLQPFQSSNQAPPRMFQGVVRSAPVTGASVGSFTTLHRGDPGDARGSSSNALDSEFLGDYNYAQATNSAVTAVWNDGRNEADCPAEDAYRDAEVTPSPLPKPAPPTDCPATFGNSDIYGGSY
jgi:hypothetical protein